MNISQLLNEIVALGLVRISFRTAFSTEGKKSMFDFVTVLPGRISSFGYSYLILCLRAEAFY